jgi:hypothetical protein
MNKKLYLFIIPFYSYSFSIPIIKNLKNPNCITCKYFNPSIIGTPTCKLFGSKDLRTNKIYYENINVCRQEEDKCGIEGNFFEEEINPLKIIWNSYKFLSIIPFLIFLGTFNLNSKQQK